MTNKELKATRDFHIEQGDIHLKDVVRDAENAKMHELMAQHHYYAAEIRDARLPACLQLKRPRLCKKIYRSHCEACRKVAM